MNLSKTSFLISAFLLTSFFCIAQSDQEVVNTFRSIQQKELTTHYDSSKPLQFDFKVIDSKSFNETSIKSDIYINNPKPLFQLTNKEEKTVTLAFDCTKKNTRNCFFSGNPYSVQYLGVSEKTDIHVVYETREIGSLFFLRSEVSTLLSVPCSLDTGYIPIFTSEYLILYSSMDYDELESVITVYKYNFDITLENDLSKAFKYVGSFRTKNWIIQELRGSEHDHSFVIKTRDEKNKTVFFEMKIKE